jgi:hypothetical protein
MCFSPESDLVAGLVITGIGVDTLRHVRHRQELPLAAVPLLLGSHQLIETFVWWGERGTVSAATGNVAMWAYLLIAFCVLPIWIPAGVMGIEPTAKRRRLMATMLVLGVGVSSVLLFQMVTGGPVVVEERAYHLYYEPHLTYGGLIVVLYILAVCVPLLMSRYRHVAAFGVVNLGAALLLAWTIKSGFTSLWCGWAAVASGAIALHLRYAEKHRPPTSRPSSCASALWRPGAGHLAQPIIQELVHQPKEA